MTQTELIDFIVQHIECTDCPVYVQCLRDQPKVCGEYISNMFRAVDAVTERAIKSQVERIRRTYYKMMREKDVARRYSLRSELTELKRQLREVKEYTNG